MSRAKTKLKFTTDGSIKFYCVKCHNSVDINIYTVTICRLKNEHTCFVQCPCCKKWIKFGLIHQIPPKFRGSIKNAGEELTNKILRSLY